MIIERSVNNEMTLRKTGSHSEDHQYYYFCLSILYIGVGITIDGKQVFNSSTIITDTTDSFSTLHCYSAAYSSSSNSSPYWILPNGEIILHSTQQYNIVRSDSKSQMLLYTSLSVKENSTYMKGLYECVIHDEHQISQVLHVWVFDKEFKGKFCDAACIQHFI